MGTILGRILVVGGLSAWTFAGTSAFADDVTRAAKAQEFFRVAKADEMLRQQMEMMAQQLKSGVIRQMTGFQVPPDKQQAVNEFQDKVVALVSQALSWDKLQPEYVKLFAEAYTEDELDAIIAFYKSPAGQAVVKKSPELMAKSGEVANHKIVAVQADMQKLLRDFISSVAPPGKP